MSPPRRVTLVADADDSLITINRVISLLRAKRFAVVSVATARVRAPGRVRLTIVVDAETTGPDRVVACLAKLEDVWNVAAIDPSDTLCRELALVKMTVPAGGPDLPPAVATRNDVRVIHRDDQVVVLEVVAEPQSVDDVIQALDPSAVVDLVRAHQLAMPLSVPSPGDT